MKRFGWRSLGLAWLASIVPGCELGKACTDVGCLDGVWVTAAPASGEWPAGDYELELTLDGSTQKCGFHLPDDLPTAGRVTTLDCGQGIQAGLEQRSECHETTSGNAVSQSCTPLPDQYELRFSLQSKPKSLGIALSRDGNVFFNDSVAPSYQISEPNGPECGPTCRQAHVDLTLEP